MFAQRNKKVVIAVIAAILAILFSPVILRHRCDATSWPLEWTVCVGAVTLAVLGVLKSRKPWQMWGILILTPIISFIATFLLLLLLHWKGFPPALYDAHGKAALDRAKKKNEMYLRGE